MIRKTMTTLAMIAVLFGVVMSPRALPTIAVGSARPHSRATALMGGAGAYGARRGVNVTGSEYACIQGWGYSERPVDAALVADATELGATAIRVPLNEDCWLGINSTSAYTGAGYRAWLDNAVATITNAGLHAILDLHWTAPLSETATRQAAMPDGHSLTFWTGVAARYKDNARVLYDAFNEPIGISNGDSEQNWACWRDGGGACPGLTDAVGMQAIVSAIRATGATQPIILGGLGYAQIMTRYLTYLPHDPLSNLIAGIHITGGWCPDVACWDRQYAPIAAVMPMIAGEIYSDGVLPVNPAGRVYTELAWLDAHGIGQVAWVDNTWGSAETLRNGNGSLSSWGWLWRAHTRASLDLAGSTIVDGGFENGWAGANSLYFGAPSIVPYAQHTGGHAEQLSAANDGVGQALGSLTPGQPITASVWATNKVAGQAVCLAFAGAGAPQAPVCSTAATYTQLTTAYTPTTTSAIVLVYKQSGFDASWVDDLSMTTTAPVSDVTPTPASSATPTPTDTPRATAAATLTQTPPALPATQTPPALPATQTPPALPATQTPPAAPNTPTPPALPATQTPPALPATQTPPAAPNTPTPTAPVPTAPVPTATANVHVTSTANPWAAIDALQTRVAWLEKRVATVDARDKVRATVVARVRGDLSVWPAP